MLEEKNIFRLFRLYNIYILLVIIGLLNKCLRWNIIWKKVVI